MAGRITVTLESAAGGLSLFQLESPYVGLYVPPNVWRTMQHSPRAVQLALTSQPFAEEDYIGEFEEFKEVWGSMTKNVFGFSDFGHVELAEASLSLR